MAFAAGQKVTAAQLNSAAPTGAVQSAVNSTVGTTTSTSYTDTLTSSTTVSLGFTTPGSGSIKVTIIAAMQNNTAGSYVAVSFRISGAAGTVAASDDYQVYTQGTGTSRPESRISGSTIITGLTPGAAGTVTMQHKVTANIGTYNYRRIIIEPIAA